MGMLPHVSVEHLSAVIGHASIAGRVDHLLIRLHIGVARVIHAGLHQRRVRLRYRRLRLHRLPGLLRRGHVTDGSACTADHR